jgi:putative ABC transport system ATP-binding protein
VPGQCILGHLHLALPAPVTSSAQPALELSEVVVCYGARTAVDGVTLSVGAGEVVALVGASGSGKSSVLHCAAGLVPVASGSVVVLGQDLAGLDADQIAACRRTDLGVVFQFSELVPELTLRQNIALPLDLARVNRREIGDRVAALVDRLGLAECADSVPARVSGGEAQRAAVHRPGLILADEPTGALDGANGAAVLDALLELARSQRAAVLLVTHDQGVAGRADRVVTVRDGRIATMPAASR